MSWEIVMGLEVHTELSTKSKIFCGCTTVYGGAPNTHVCPGCTGMPGTLPFMNRSVVEYAMRLGIVLNCDIAKVCRFDRKNYFYPDLPKAYQVSQLHAPICKGGYLEIELDGQKKKIGLAQIHMEEDAGKLVHGANETFIDYNRGAVPLLEIVSQPDFRSAAEVIAYLEKLRETLLYLEVSDCKMQEGSLRADINLSVRKPGGELGVRTEMKNINSFKAIARAIEYEASRQIDLLEDGGQVIQETRRWDDDKGQSFGMRSKADAQDYRYFPDPDLLPIQIDETWLQSVRTSLPELACQKRERYMRDFKVPQAEAVILTVHKNISNLFEDAARQSGQPVEAAHMITGEIMRLMNNTNTLPEDLCLDAGKLSALIALVLGAKINRGAYKETIEAVFTNNVDPEKYIAEKGLLMLNDDNAVNEAVKAVLAEEQGSVAEYLAGKEKVFGFLMGQVMKKLRGKGNPEVIKKTLTEMLQK
jgi:aspartyl-tRNA(Asn)/glutamyl-tRNA(Gln) amidotransferase subunit B